MDLTPASNQSPFASPVPPTRVIGGIRLLPNQYFGLPQAINVDTTFHVLWATGALLIAIGAIIVFWMLFGRRMVRHAARSCPRCRYDMTGIAALKCPECGREAKSERSLALPRRGWGLALVGVLMIVAGWFLPLVGQGGMTWVTSRLPDRVLILTWRVQPDLEATSNEMIARLQSRSFSGSELRMVSSAAVSVLSKPDNGSWNWRLYTHAAIEGIQQAGKDAQPAWDFLRETYWHEHDPFRSGGWIGTIRLMIAHDPAIHAYFKERLELLALAPRFDFPSPEAFEAAMDEGRANRAVLALRLMTYDEDGRCRDAYPLVAKLLIHPQPRVRDAAKNVLVKAGSDAEGAIIAEAGAAPERFIGYFISVISQRRPTHEAMAFLQNAAERAGLPLGERLAAAKSHNSFAKTLGIKPIFEPIADPAATISTPDTVQERSTR